MPRAWKVVMGATAGLALWQCGNGATGVEACRKIEQKKCDLAIGCPEVPAAANRPIADEGAATACKLFYRDQCLLGMADSADPGEGEVDRCLAALDAAAACKSVTFAACAAAPVLASGQDKKALTACEVILVSEKLADCAFLKPPASPTASSSAGGGPGGGQGGGGGAGGS